MQERCFLFEINERQYTMKSMERKGNLSIGQIKDAAHGREIDILEHVAGIPAEYLDRKGHPCPKCGDGDDRFSLIDSDRGAVLCRYCFHEKNGDFVAAVQHFRAVDLPEALRLIGDYLGTQSPALCTEKKVIGIWVYTAQNGKPLYRVKRVEWTEAGDRHKSFFQERYTGGKWELGLKGVELVPFNWPALGERAGDVVYIVEGEKCSDALSPFGVLATTASGGSHSKIDWSKFLSGRRVVILPDNDAPGYEYALRVADQLHGSNEIKVVFLPGLLHKGDVADWITAEGTQKEFSRIVKDAPVWDGKPFRYEGNEPDFPEPSEKIDSPPAAKNKKTEAVSYVPKLINPEHVETKPIPWLWENKIPLEMITVFAGRQGGGKTFWSCYLAAVVTNGWNWADGSASPKGSALFFYGEDAVESILVPRLKAQGADLSKIRILDGFIKTQDGEEVGELELTLHVVDQIRDAIRLTEQETGEPVRLVVVDPVSNYWGGIKENDNAQVRAVLKPIQRLAAETGVAFLLITHFGKAVKEEAADKVIGSIAITAVPRTVWHLYRDKNDKDARYFVPSKDNVLIDPTGVEFTVNRQADGRVEIISCDLEKHADDFEAEQFDRMQERRSGRGRKPEQTEAALEWLETFLADGRKPVGSRDNPAAGSVRFEAEAAGHSIRTVDRASAELNVVKRRELNVYFWSLPEQDGQVCQNCGRRHTGNFGIIATCENISTCESGVPSVPELKSTGNSGPIDLLGLSERPDDASKPATPTIRNEPPRYQF